MLHSFQSYVPPATASPRRQVSSATEVHERDLDAAAAPSPPPAQQPASFPPVTSEYDRAFAWPRLWRRERAMQTAGDASVNTAPDGTTLAQVLEYDPREPVSALRYDPNAPVSVLRPGAPLPPSHHFRTVPTGSGESVQILVDEEAAAGNEPRESANATAAPWATSPLRGNVNAISAHDVLGRGTAGRFGPMRLANGSGAGDDSWLTEYDMR